MSSIILGNRQFTYAVTKKRIRSLNLRLRGVDNFVVSCPYLTPGFVITKFIREHESWILANSQKYATKALSTSLPSSLVILDQPYRLIYRQSSRSSVVFLEDAFQIFINHPTLSPGPTLKLLDQKLRPHALRHINHDLRLLASTHHFHYGRVSIRNQSSRFGSCSSTNNLSFNWQIILFSRLLYLHILLHELTHTIHHNHSPRFWHQLGLYDPEYLLHRRWLKTEAQKFLIFSQ